MLERYLTRDGLPGRFKHHTSDELDSYLEHQLDGLFPDAA